MKKIIILLLLVVVGIGFIAWFISDKKKKRLENEARLREERRRKRKEEIEQAKQAGREENAKELREELEAEYDGRLVEMQLKLDETVPYKNLYIVTNDYLKRVYTLPAQNNHVTGAAKDYALDCFNKSNCVYYYSENPILGDCRKITTLECLDPIRYLYDDAYWIVIENNIDILRSHIKKINPKSDNNSKHFREIFKILKVATGESQKANSRKTEKKKRPKTEGGIAEPVKDHDKIEPIPEADELEDLEDIFEDVPTSKNDDFIK